MFEDTGDEMGAGETAASYTDMFVDAGVAKLDALFGEGYAKNNPALLASYMAASAVNLQSFMTAAANQRDDFMDKIMAAATMLEEDEPAAPASSPVKKKGRR